MNIERVAFLYPFYADENDSPLVVFDCEEIPAIIDVNFKVFLMDLIHDEAVYLQSQILKVNNDKEEPVSVEKGFWLKAEDSQGRLDDIMASVKMTFEDCNFITEGVYCIRVSILKDNKITNSNQAYFKVSQVYDKPKS